MLPKASPTSQAESHADSDPLISDSHDRAPTPATSSTDQGRACCACRRESFCDGGRRCSACVEKGLNNDRCIEGCRACRQARLICDGRKPCSNCSNLNQECSDITDVANVSFDPVSTTGEAKPSHTAQSGGRAKVACFGCRRDNKRCGNARPCARCLFRKEECINLERQQKVVKKRCYACRMGNKKCENRRPCASCVEGGVECLDIIRKPTGPGTRIKRACTHCRRGKVQCDNGRPCKNCVRRGFECDPQLPVEPDERGHSRNASSAEGSRSTSQQGQAFGAAAQAYGTSAGGTSADRPHGRHERRLASQGRGRAYTVASSQPSMASGFASSSSARATYAPSSPGETSVPAYWIGERSQANDQSRTDAAGPSMASTSSSPSASYYADQPTDESEYYDSDMDEDAA